MAVASNDTNFGVNQQEAEQLEHVALEGVASTFESNVTTTTTQEAGVRDHVSIILISLVWPWYCINSWLYYHLSFRFR